METFGAIFEIMTNETENKMCVDCMKPYPLYASVNNGVFLCESCAEKHYGYGINISYVKHLKSEWDEYLMCYMRRGGNKRFKEFLKEYEIIEDSDLYYKYRTKAVENYRLIIRSEVLAEEPPEKISKLQGVLISENIMEVNNYPEFENYQFIGNLSDLEDQDKLVQENNFTSKFKNFFGKIGQKAKIVADKIKDKFDEMQLGDRIRSTGKKFIVVMQETEGFIIMKSQPVMEKISEKSKIGIEKISAKTKEGFNVLAGKTKEVYKSLKSKIIRSENKTEKLLEETQQNSNYYELKTNHQQNENNIINFINEEHKNENRIETNALSSNEVVEANLKFAEKEKELNDLNGINSFTLFNESLTSENEENINNSNKHSFPTLQEIESYDRMPRIFTDKEKEIDNSKNIKSL